MTARLTGKRIVIIGGTTGLGLSAARAMVAENASVVVVGRNPDSAHDAQAALDAIAPGMAHAMTGDATAAETAETAISRCIEMFGGFDALYHVAGGSGRSFGDGPLHDITEEGIDRTLDLNLKSVILSNRAAVRSFLDRRIPGAILNMGSVLGYSPSPRHFSTHVYAAAKAAIIGFSKSAAARYAADDIRFNVIAPALVETPMAKRAAENAEILGFIRHKQPLDGGRIGKPEDLDALAVCLLSDGGRYITGQVIAVDGGWSVSEGLPPVP
jgi:NAD(P)-dependent dehydrogenase (short-subunit alcohol dehydrogenase family)